MQNKGTKKKPVIEQVRKPILMGSWHGKDAWQLAFKRGFVMIAVSFVYLISGALLSFENVWGRFLSCLATIVVAGYYLYASGMAQGQTDAAFGEILYTRQQNGQAVPKDEQDRSFHPLKGLFAVLVGALPFVIFTLVFAFMTEKTVYHLGTLPAWAATLTTQSEFGDALRYYETVGGMGAMDALRIVDRAMIMPFINVATYFGTDAALLAERLSPILILIAPMGYALGYAQGLNVRARINTGIKMGDDKKKRRERKARKQRQRSQAPERLI